LHFSITSDSNNESDIRARSGRMISPLQEKTLSNGAEVAGNTEDN